MKVNLRKANLIQKRLGEFAAEPVPATTINIDKYVNATEALATQRDGFARSILTKAVAIGLQYGIRNMIADANHNTGITEKIGELACLSKTAALYSSIKLNGLYPGDEAVLSQQADLSAAAQNGYYTKPQFAVSILEQDVVDDLARTIKAIKRSMKEIEDKLLELNLSNEIELTETDVKLLTDLSIL